MHLKSKILIFFGYKEGYEPIKNKILTTKRIDKNNIEYFSLSNYLYGRI
jgi:hypothetical protein